jgi:hypothetical protein
MEVGKDAPSAEQMSDMAKLLLRRVRSVDVHIGHTPEIDRMLESKIRFELLKPIRSDDHARLADNYRKLACSISKAISENYLSLTLGIRTGNMPVLLASLSEHIMAELKLALELKFPRPAYNLRRNSVSEIQAVIDNLSKNSDPRVRTNARAIVIAALNRINLVYVQEILRTDYGQ